MEKRIVKRIQVGIVNPKATRVGEHHQNSVLSDYEVELIRSIYEDGVVGYETIAKAFGVSKASVRDLVTYRRRAATPDAYKTVEVTIVNGEIVKYRDIEKPSY